MSFGSAKSSGSIAESEGSSVSSDSSGSLLSGSSEGSGDAVDDSLGSGNSGSSDSDSSSGGYCSWEIESITYHLDNEMSFFLHNTGTVDIEFTAIWIAIDPSMIRAAIAPPVSPYSTGASFTVAPGASQPVAIVSDEDLRAVEFYVDGSCGLKLAVFPIS